MMDSHITRGRGRPRKTIRETIKKDLKINELDRNVVYGVI